jgi:hypothetical protein
LFLASFHNEKTLRPRKFEVSVDLELVWKSSRGVNLSAPQGFIAVAQIRVAGAIRSMVAPIRLTEDDRRPFATEAEALMAGYSAGQRIVDDTFSLFEPTGIGFALKCTRPAEAERLARVLVSRIVPCARSEMTATHYDV